MDESRGFVELIGADRPLIRPGRRTRPWFGTGWAGGLGGAVGGQILNWLESAAAGTDGVVRLAVEM
ncbi:MAG: hypothetical protein OXG11_00005 [Chloroflexi bacterium]|nr:hypothetical protein [Chloroflexota bacterium]